MRSTEDKLIHIPLNTGMNQAVDARLAPTGTLTSVKNCRIPANGLPEKRPGSIALTGTTANSPTHSLQGDGITTNIESPSFACQVQSALMVGNTYGDAFAFSTVWQFQGRFSTCLPVRKRYGLAVDDTLVSGDGFGQTAPDIVVTSSGYVGVVAITTQGHLHFYIEDQNGVRIYYFTDASVTYIRARLTVQVDSINLTTQVGVNISNTVLTIASGVVSSSALAPIVPLFAVGSSWDVSSYSQTAWFLAYQNAAAQVGLVKLNGNTNVTSAFFAVVALPEVTLWSDPITQQLWFGLYDNAIDVRFSVWDVSSAIVNVKALTTLKSAALLGPPMFGRYRGVVPNTTKKAFYCFFQCAIGGPFTAATWVGAAFGSATAPTTPVACWHVTPISKPDNFNRVWCLVNSFVSNQLLTRTLLLRFSDESLTAPPTIELSGPNMPVIAKSFSPFAVWSGWFSTIAIGSTRNYIALPNVIQQFYSAQAIVRIEVYEYTTADQEAHRHANRFGITTTIAGQPVELWGQSVSTVNNALSAGNRGAFNTGASEIGFPHAPIIFSITPSNSGPGFGAVGTRSWRVTYESVDLYGRRHQSAPSNPVSSTSDASHVSATLVIGTTDITQRQSANTGLRVFLKLYRTVAGGTEYHECATTAIAFAQATGLVTFIDLEADSDIAQSGFLYTDGGVLDDTLAPSCRFTAKSEDRMWFGGLWDPTIIQCSKVIVPGEPIQCTDDFSHQVQLPGDCTGLAYMDGNVIAFTADATYLVSGDGPNDQGAGSFPPPRCLTRSVGCCEYRSIVETNIGVMFQANQGFYLLPCGFGPVQYIGAGVRDDMAALGNSDLDLGPVVLGAISHTTRDDHLARFLVASGESPTNGTDVFTFDVDSGRWYHDTFGFGLGEIGAYDSLLATGKKGAVFVHADLSSSSSATPVALETPSQPADESGAFVITQSIETAWVHPFGLGGFGKVNCVLFAVESFGATQTLDVTVQTDHNTAETSSYVITGAQLNYRELVVNVRACTAVQIQMRCAAPAGATGGFKFISCTLEVEPTAGIRLLSDAEKS
jgi:hypothetical protein